MGDVLWESLVDITGTVSSIVMGDAELVDAIWSKRIKIQSPASILKKS